MKKCILRQRLVLFILEKRINNYIGNKSSRGFNQIRALVTVSRTLTPKSLTIHSNQLLIYNG